MAGLARPRPTGSGSEDRKPLHLRRSVSKIAEIAPLKSS